MSFGNFASLAARSWGRALTMIRTKTWVAWFTILSAFVCLNGAAAGPAINQFEIKDLQSSPGDFEFQSQNAWSTGQPRRKQALSPDDETLYDDNTVVRQREALEVQLGITDWFRVRLGIEYEQERLDDPAVFADANSFGALTFDEVAIEGVLVFLKPKKEGVGLGLLVEYGSPVGDKAAASELYIGPIIEAHTGPWSAIANLMLVKHIGGTSPDPDFVRDEKWDFSYFTQLKYEFSSAWSLAAEAYGTLDRLGTSGAPGIERDLFGDHDQHRAGAIVYYTFFPNPPSAVKATKHSSGGEDDDDVKQWSVTVGTGVLYGLNENTPDRTYKLSIEVDY